MVPDAPIHCASGTRHLGGDDILAAVRAQNIAAAARSKGPQRSEAEWRDAYAAAMAERRRAEAPATPAAPALPKAREPARKTQRPATLPPASPYAFPAIIGAVGVAISFAA